MHIRLHVRHMVLQGRFTYITYECSGNIHAFGYVCMYVDITHARTQAPATRSYCACLCDMHVHKMIFHHAMLRDCCIVAYVHEYDTIPQPLGSSDTPSDAPFGTKRNDESLAGEERG